MTDNEDERPYQCPFCEYSAHKKGGLDKHVKGIHGKTAGKLIPDSGRHFGF